jgi:hypothetical protein
MTPNTWTDSLARWRLSRFGHRPLWLRLLELLGLRKPSNVIHIHEWTREHEAKNTERMRAAIRQAAKAMDAERRKR